MIRYETWPHVLCLIDALCAHGSWCGASHIQKATCIAQELSAVSVDFDYRYHPYCFELREVLVELEAAGAVSTVSRDGWEPGYRITDRGFGFWAQFERSDFNSTALEFVAIRLSGLSLDELTRLATAFLVEKELPGASLEVQVDRWAGYQPDISLEAARQSLTIAKTWRKEWAQQTDRAPMSSVSSPKAR